MKSNFERKNFAPFAPRSAAEIKAAEVCTPDGVQGCAEYPHAHTHTRATPHTMHTPPKGGVCYCGCAGYAPDPNPTLKNGVCRTVQGGGKKRGKKSTLVIIEDTRENTPLTKWPEGVETVERGLDTGDYSVVGWENCFCIERKTIGDLAGTMLGGFEGNSQKPRKRFNNELERMRHFDCAAVIVTATPQQLIEFRHNCGMDAHAALWNFALSVFATYGIPVFPLGDEETAARWIADLARHYINCRTRKNRQVEIRRKSDPENAAWGF